jgi:protein-arginine kinase activator protein McsA
MALERVRSRNFPHKSKTPQKKQAHHLTQQQTALYDATIKKTISEETYGLIGEVKTSGSATEAPFPF